MRDAAASRVAADLCFFFLLFCLFSPAAPALPALGLLVVCCIVFGVPAVRAGRLWLRLLLLLPPLAVLLLAPDTVTRVGLGLGWAYFALLFALDRAGLEYWTYRRAFPVMAAVTLLICLYIGAAKTMTVQTPAGVLLFAAAFLLLGLHTLRALRMGATTDLGWKLWSLLELAVPGAAGGGLLVLLSLLLRNAGRVFELLFAPVFWIIRLFSDLMGLLFSGVDLDTSVSSVNEITDLEGLETVESAPAPTAIPVPRLNDWMNENPVPWRSLLILLGALIALILLALYLLRGRKAKTVPASVLVEDRFRPLRARRGRAAPQDNAQRVREAYRGYLRFLEMRGRSVRVGDTSADVIAQADPEADTAAEWELRALYLTARYGDAAAVTPEAALRAEQCLALIRDRN